MKLKLAVVRLWSGEVNRTVDFYRDVLGLPLLMVDRGRPHFDFGGGYLVILPGKPHSVEISTMPRFPVLAFAADNLYEVIHQLDAHHIEMPWGVEEDTDSRRVMFRDPGGNLIEVAMMGVNAHHQ